MFGRTPEPEHARRLLPNLTCCSRSLCTRRTARLTCTTIVPRQTRVVTKNVEITCTAAVKDISTQTGMCMPEPKRGARTPRRLRTWLPVHILYVATLHLGPRDPTIITSDCGILVCMRMPEEVAFVRWQAHLRSNNSSLSIMLSVRCVGTFTPLITLLRGSCIARRVRFLACFLLSKPAVSMRADAFPPCFPCAGTTAATPQQQQPAEAAAAAASGGSSCQKQPAAAAAAAKKASAALVAERRVATAGGGVR